MIIITSVYVKLIKICKSLVKKEKERENRKYDTYNFFLLKFEIPFCRNLPLFFSFYF